MFKIALTNVNFDKDYKNVLDFNTQAEQHQFFDIPSIFEKSNVVRFNIETFHTTKLTVKKDDVFTVNQLNYNYLIVQDITNNKYYYYFITNIVHDNANQSIYDIELDIFQTYYLESDLNECIIERTHLDRSDYNNERFNFNAQSPLHIDEPIPSLAKRFVQRKKITPNVVLDTVDTGHDFNKWMDDNILGWVLIFLKEKDPTTGGYDLLEYVDSDLTKKPEKWYRTTNYFNKSDIYYLLGDPSYLTKNPFVVLTYPIYRNETVDNKNEIYVRYIGSKGKTQIGSFNQSGVESYIQQLNGGETNILSKKITSICPLRFNQNDLTYDSANNLYYIQVPTGPGIVFNQVMNCVYPRSTAGFVIPIISGQDVVNFTTSEPVDVIDYYPSTPFDPDTLIEPKLFTEKFIEFNITNGIDSFTLDITKINPYQKIQFVINEILTPDLTLTTTSPLLNTINNDDGVYVFDNYKTQFGLVSKHDYTLGYSTTALEQYLSQNKNFFLQNYTNMALNIGRSATGGMNNLHNQLVDQTFNQINRTFTIDNMRNAPSTVSNVNAQPFAQMIRSSFGLFLDIYDSLESDKLGYRNLLFRNGYTFNRFGKPKEFANTRTRFNYIKCDLEGIDNIRINEKIRLKFKEIFKNGIRIWHDPESFMNFDIPNPERR